MCLFIPSLLFFFKWVKIQLNMLLFIGNNIIPGPGDYSPTFTKESLNLPDSIARGLRYNIQSVLGSYYPGHNNISFY